MRAGPAITISRWVRATFFGWIAGVPVIAVVALLGEVLRIGGAQALVGLGMGVSVGFSQGRAIRSILGGWSPWMWMTTVGVAVPFLLADGLRALDYGHRYALEMSLAVSGLTVGVGQAMLIAATTPKRLEWIFMSVLAWTTAAVCAFAAEALPGKGPVAGLAGAGLFLGLVALGGLAIGGLTGLVLVRLVRDPAVSA